MTLSIFPDVNVWLALCYPAHVHHGTADSWFTSLDEAAVFVFCRQTQLGLFRILTTDAVMGKDVRSQRECWALYDRWIDPGKAVLAMEPASLDRALRSRCMSDSPAPKTWMDAYLAAFAEAARLNLVTFDRALAAKAKGALLLT
jgi:toxin-antitoxin system PIN domain toxin